MNSSTHDKAAGNMKMAGGTVKEKVGHAVGNEKMETEGKAKHLEGEVQHKVGEAKKVVGQ